MLITSVMDKDGFYFFSLVMCPCSLAQEFNGVIPEPLPIYGTPQVL